VTGSKWDGQHDRRGDNIKRWGPLEFSMKVTIADVLTLLGAAALVLVAFIDLKGDSREHATRLLGHDKEIGELKRNDERMRDEILASLRDIRERLDRMADGKRP
jgi:hypothetical protein